MATIAVGGMQHETNTFAPTRADLQAFMQGGGWPGLARGARIREAIEGANIPAAGAIEALERAGHRVVPLVWAAASPSAHVTHHAFETIVGELVQALSKAGPVDGVYLDLHGAMVTEDHDDGEGEILARVRAAVGAHVPVVASLDLHANVTRRMVQCSDALSVYRSYPHVDMAQTGERAAHLLDRMIRRGAPLAKAFSSCDYLTAIVSQCTMVDPARSLYQSLEQLESQTGVALSLAMGFPMADFAECGMSVTGYGEDPAKTEQAVMSLKAAVDAAEASFELKLLSPEEAVRAAIARGRPGAPIVLADTQDNPGAGGNGDTTAILAQLLKAQAQEALFGLLIDEASAARAHEAGVGATLEFSLGERSGLPGHQPLSGRFTVERLGDGEVTCTGPMYRGFRTRLGPMALLRCGGVRVALASRKAQTADQALFRHLGVEPARQRIVVVKSSVHFRADFAPIAQDIWVVAAPGPALVDPSQFAWKKLRPGLRLRPLGPAFGDPHGR
jgi:microcystin degradation protein MlrC